MEEVKYAGLKAEMARTGEGQKNLAELLNLSVSAVCRKLAGFSDWSISEIEAICNHYEKDYYELFK